MYDLMKVIEEFDFDSPNIKTYRNIVTNVKAVAYIVDEESLVATDDGETLNLLETGDYVMYIDSTLTRMHHRLVEENFKEEKC